MKTYVYVDGFNLYFGRLEGSPYKWLDLAKLLSLEYPHDTIAQIRYFTARITARATDPDKPRRQQIYLRALRTIPNLSVHLGRYTTHATRAALVKPPPTGPRTAEVWVTREKGSDVNLATYLLVDGFGDAYEKAVIVSNDSDLVEPIKVVRHRFGRRVEILNPYPNRPSKNLRQVADFVRPLRRGPLSASQLPAQLADAKGIFTKPASW